MALILQDSCLLLFHPSPPPPPPSAIGGFPMAIYSCLAVPQHLCFALTLPPPSRPLGHRLIPHASHFLVKPQGMKKRL